MKEFLYDAIFFIVIAAAFYLILFILMSINDLLEKIKNDKIRLFCLRCRNIICFLFCVFLVIGNAIYPDNEKKEKEMEQYWEDFWEQKVYILKEELYLEYTEDFEDVKYHNSSCPLIKNKETLEITMETASDEFYQPCSKCNPEHW